MDRFLTGVFLSTAFFAASPALGADRFTTISIINQSPDFEVSPSIQIFGQPPAGFVEAPRNNFSYQFKLADDEWFDIADINLVWKRAYINNDNSKSDFNQRIQLRFRYRFPQNFAFPVYFSNKRSQAEMLRLEQQLDPNQQWENFFRGWQIAHYYRNTNGPQYPLAQRASWMFFNAADALAEAKYYYVVMSDDAIKFEQDAFGDARTAIVTPRINDAKSAFWEDLSRVEGLIPGNCPVARILLTELQKAKDNEPNLFALRYPSAPNTLDEKLVLVNSKCPSP
jgi:hypothetical protein